MTTAIILSHSPHALFPVQFDKYLSHHFQDWQVERGDYSRRPKDVNQGNLVFAQSYTPIPDYKTILKVIKAEGNRVFILSEGIGYNRQDVRDLGIDGVIFRLYNRDFEGFTWLSAQGIKPAERLLRDLVV